MGGRATLSAIVVTDAPAIVRPIGHKKREEAVSGTASEKKKEHHAARLAAHVS